MWSVVYKEKRASALSITKVSPNAQGWVDEVIDKLLDLYPFFAKYGLEGKLLSTDPERLYGWGYVRAFARAGGQQREIYVPFVISNQRLLPMRVFLLPNGRADLLTRDLVERALFTPSVGVAAANPEGPGAGSGLLEAMYPPSRYTAGSVGALGMNTSIATKVSSLLSREEVEQTLAPLVKTSSGNIADVVRAWVSNAGKQKDGYRRLERPLAVHIKKKQKGTYEVKVATATEDGFEVSGNITTAVDLRDLLGEDVVHKADQDGNVIISTTPIVRQRLEDIRVEPVKDYGIWKVQLVTGEQAVGWVITNVIDVEMRSVPLKLFTSGYLYSLQEEIAGVRVSQGLALPRKKPEPQDFGFFYNISPQGRVTAFLPMQILRVVEDAGGKRKFRVKDVLGGQFDIYFEPGLKAAIKISMTEYALPNTLLFSPLGKEVKLIPSAALFKKTASKEQEEGVRVGEVAHDGAFRFLGPLFSFLDKTASYTEGEAAAILAAVGVSPAEVPEKLARARLLRSAFVRGLPVTKLGTAEEPQIYREEDVASLRRDTVKIAEGLPEIATPRSIDAVLSLNFINRENVQLFLQSLPSLEEARRDLADLYIAIVLGLPDVPLQSVITAMESLKDVTDGLKKLVMRLDEEK